MSKAFIKDIACYIPTRRVSNQELISEININHAFLKNGILERIFGIEERRFAAKDQQVSDMASLAAKPILDKIDPSTIDLLIFASACSDLIEPATSNIVQHKLQLHCPTMDIKNACNSFVSAIHTATAFIQAGIYKNILIVNGEKLSDAINRNITDTIHLKRALAAFSLGDGAAAALISESSDEDQGFFFQKFMTKGENWDLCTIQGGGSMFPHNANKNFFEGETAALKNVILDEAKDFIQTCFEEAGWNPKKIDHLITHQVSTQTFEIICNNTGIPQNRNISVFEKYGNVAAASIPLAICEGIKSGKIKRGDKLAIIGLAAGISASVQFLKW